MKNLIMAVFISVLLIGCSTVPKITGYTNPSGACKVAQTEVNTLLAKQKVDATKITALNKRVEKDNVVILFILLGGVFYVVYKTGLYKKLIPFYTSVVSTVKGWFTKKDVSVVVPTPDPIVTPPVDPTK